MPYATKIDRSKRVLYLPASRNNFSTFLQNIFKKFSSFFRFEEKNYGRLPNSCFDSKAMEYHVLLNDKIDPFLQVQIHLN